MNSNGTTLRLALVEPRSAGVALHRDEGTGQDADRIWRALSGDGVLWFSDSGGNTLSVTGPA